MRRLLWPTIRFLLTIIAAALVAWLVAIRVLPSESSDAPLTVPPARIDQRPTVSLAPVRVQPTLQGDGTVVEIEDGSFALQATISPADMAYRLMDDPVGVNALILGGPVGFDCPWIGLVEAGGGLMMQCAIPDDVRVVSGLQGTMVLQLDTPTEVSALPVTAVLGDTERGQVVVMRDDGTTTIRDVELLHRWRAH